VSFAGLPRVNRLDLVRDFDLRGSVLGADEVIGSMASVSTTLRAVKAHYRDATAKQAQTMMVRTKRGGSGRLYDKGRESGLEAAQGHVRFEAQERSRSLRRGGVLFLSDLGSADLEAMGKDRFAWCGFDTTFSPSVELFSRVRADAELTEGQKLQLIAFYALGSEGMAVTLERNRFYRLRKLARRFGYPSESSYRLDWDEGLIAA
jgi:hypothetical protein